MFPLNVIQKIKTSVINRILFEMKQDNNFYQNILVSIQEVFDVEM